MKILMATNGLDIGGAETHIVELAKELRRQGHKLLVVSNGGVYVEELEKAGIRHIKAPLNSRALKPMYRSYQILKRTIQEEKPDVVHAHARIPGFLCGRLCRAAKRPFVTSCHGVYQARGALKLLSDWGKYTLAVSDDIRSYLHENYGIEQSHIISTINGIDTEKFSPHLTGEEIRREFSLGDGPVICHSSRLDKASSLAARQLIEQAPMLSKEVPGVQILIAGGGDVYEELRSKAEQVNKSLGRECLILTGPRTDINRVVAVGDLFVGVSRSALEAMAAAKPVVLSGAQGHLGLLTPELLERAVASNFCCRTDPIAQGDQLGRAVLAALALSGERKAQLGAFGRQVVLEHYSVGRMAQDALTAYDLAIPPKNILISGYYGYSNAGDEAILEALNQSVRRTSPGTVLTVLSGNPTLTEATYGCRAVPRFSPWRLYKAVKDCDALISGGGSLLQDATSTRSLLYYLLVIRMAERQGKKVFLLANGIGPVRKRANRRRVARAVREAEYITLRDPASEAELQSMGVDRADLAVTADPVYLLEPGDPAVAQAALDAAGVGEDPFLAVSIRPWKNDEALENTVAAICDGAAVRYGLKPLFIPMQQGVDDVMARRIIGKMKEKGYLLENSPRGRDIMAVLGKSRLVLSMRLHSLIFAANMEVPSVGISYDPKLDANLELLGQPSAGTVETLEAEAALRLIGETLEHREERVNALSAKRRELSASALRNEEIMAKL